MNVEDGPDHPATPTKAQPSGRTTSSRARSIVHTGRLWLLLKRARPQSTVKLTNDKPRSPSTEPAPMFGPQLTTSPAGNVASPAESDSEAGESASKSQPHGSVAGRSFARLRPPVALRMFGLLGLGVVILLTLVLELLNYVGALGMVTELFDRLRLLVALASGVALAVLVAVMFKRHRRRARLFSQNPTPR